MVYIPIPKNASTTMEGTLEVSYGIKKQDFSNYYDLDADRYIVLIRNPIDRWTSGYIQDGGNEDTISEYIVGDHTLPQCDYLDFDYLDIGKCLFFYLNPKEKYHRGARETSLITRLNKKAEQSLKFVQAGNNKEDMFKNNLLNKADLKHLRLIYDEDYELISKVELN
jgi:hypothetical protein